MSKYRVFSDPYFHAFGLNMERYEVSLRIQFECGKIRTRKNSFFGHFHAKFSTRKKLKSKYNINYRYDINFKFFCSYCSLLVLHKFWIKFHVSITIMKGFCTQMISFEIWNLEKPFSGFSAFLLTTILVIIFWNLVIKF